MNSTIPVWKTEATPTDRNYMSSHPTCNMNNMTSKMLTLIILLVGLAGNVAVLILLGFRIRRNAFSVYILNLAAADFLFLCFNSTAFVLDVIKMFLRFSVPTYGIVRTGGIMCYIAGLSMLSAISTERCLSVLWPIWYHCHRPTHMSAVMCALFWALSIFAIGRCKTVNFIIAAWLMFLFVILSGSSLTLLGRILCGSRRMQLSRLYVTILLTVLVFLLCGLPFGIYLFLVYWIHNDSYTLGCLNMVSFVLSSVNSGANPIIYFFVGSFRQQSQNLKLVLERALQDTPEKDEGGNSLSQGTLEMSESRVGQR
uniref:Mas-related G-protein coupled receptor member X2-like n=1 Tax=Ictidomys tridecemlineatus TaxID=43179 RepID=A0A287D2A5_ICTTR